MDAEESKIGSLSLDLANISTLEGTVVKEVNLEWVGFAQTNIQIHVQIYGTFHHVKFVYRLTSGHHVKFDTTQHLD